MQEEKEGGYGLPSAQCQLMHGLISVRYHGQISARYQLMHEVTMNFSTTRGQLEHLHFHKKTRNQDHNFELNPEP